jgi:hypothetical protein
MPDDASWTDPVVVPDDARALQPEIDAYRRELRQAARRRRVQRITGSGAWRSFALPLLVAGTAIAVASVVFLVLTFGATRSRPPQPRALAPTASAPIGSVGGLLPDVSVRVGARHESIRNLRPALVTTVPVPCECTDLMQSLAAQAAEAGVPLVVVAPTAQDAEIDALPGRVHGGRLVPAFDSAGALAHTYSASGVTALVVAADGVVTFVQKDVTVDQRLEFPLQLMATTSG